MAQQKDFSSLETGLTLVAALKLSHLQAGASCLLTCHPGVRINDMLPATARTAQANKVVRAGRVFARAASCMFIADMKQAQQLSVEASYHAVLPGEKKKGCAAEQAVCTKGSLAFSLAWWSRQTGA